MKVARIANIGFRYERGGLDQGCEMLQEERSSQTNLERRATQELLQPKRRLSGVSASTPATEAGRQPSQLALSSPLTSLTIPEVGSHKWPCPSVKCRQTGASVQMALACNETA